MCAQRLSVVGPEIIADLGSHYLPRKIPGTGTNVSCNEAMLQDRLRHQFRIDGTTGGLPRCGPK